MKNQTTAELINEAARTRREELTSRLERHYGKPMTEISDNEVDSFLDWEADRYDDNN